MQTALLRIWSQIIKYIFYDDKHYATHTLVHSRLEGEMDSCLSISAWWVQATLTEIWTLSGICVFPHVV